MSISDIIMLEEEEERRKKMNLIWLFIFFSLNEEELNGYKAIKRLRVSVRHCDCDE